jgi:hypothetical protein
MQNHTSPSQPSPHVSASVHQQGIVFFHAKHGQLFAANHTGADIWRGLEQQLSPEHIAEGLSRRYQIPLDAARAHTTRFIAQLTDGRLVERRMA